MLDAFCFATQPFHLKCTDREFNPDPKTLMGFALMALLTLTSTPGGMVQPALYQLCGKDNTQALILP